MYTTYIGIIRNLKSGNQYGNTLIILYSKFINNIDFSVALKIHSNIMIIKVYDFDNIMYA